MIIWFYLALAAAFFDATSALVNKHILKNLDELTSATGVFLGSSIILLIASGFKGIPVLGDKFIIAVLGTAILNVIAALIFFRALKRLDLSLAIPLLSFTPVFMLLSSFVLLGELPSKIGVLGILSVVVGVYVMNLKQARTSIFKPITEIFRNRYMFYMLITSFIFSISSSIDKVMVLNSDPFFGSGVVYLLAGCIFLVAMLIQKKPIKPLFTTSSKFLITGISGGLAAIAINFAYTLQIAPYVLTIKRTSVLFSVLYGWLIFKERETLRRFIGALIMGAGVVLILVF